MARKYTKRLEQTTQEPLTPVEPVRVPVLVIKETSPAAKYVKSLLANQFDLNLGDEIAIYGNEPYAIDVIKKYACRVTESTERESARQLLEKMKQQ